MCYDIVVVNSPLFKEPDYISNSDEYLPPIGLGYISSYLISKNISVYLLDTIAENMSYITLLNKLTLLKPKFIAINIFSTNFNLVKEIIETIDFEVHFIIGGISTKSLYDAIFKWKTKNNIDIVYGDGELITYDMIMLNKLKQDPFKSIKNKRYFIVDKDSLYFNHNISNLPLDRRLFKNEPIMNVFDKKEVSLIASRGCTFSCAYCSASYKRNKGLTVRERTLDSLVDELNKISILYEDVQTIRILDDLFLKDENSLKKAISVFNMFEYTWRGMAHINSIRNITQELFNDLNKSGCFELSIGIESGSKNIIKMIKKNTKREVVLSVIERLFIANISVKGYFILGFPGEEEKDMQDTYKLAYKISELAKKYSTIFRVSVFQFRPYHGTDLYDMIFSDEDLYIEENKELSNMIGRNNFNFTAGNYSKVDTSILNDYISKLHSLN